MSFCKKINIGGREETISLNNHLVTVNLPKKNLSFEDGAQELNKLIAKITKKK